MNFYNYDRIKMGNFFKHFRTSVLHLTQQEMYKITGIDVMSISRWENGKSSRIEYIKIYFDLCKTEKQKEKLMKGVFEIL